MIKVNCNCFTYLNIIKEWVWIAMEITIRLRLLADSYSLLVIRYLPAPRKAALPREPRLSPPRGSTPCEQSKFTGLFVKVRSERQED